MEKLLQEVYQGLLAPSTSLDYWQELIAEADTSFAQVLAEFIKQAGLISNPERSSKFIEAYQVLCIDIVNQIDNMDSFALPLAREASIKYRDVALKLLSFIESHYPHLMNLNIDLPLKQSDKLCTDMMAQLEQMEEKHAEHDSELFPLLKAVLAKDLNDKIPISYGRYFVWKKVFASMEVMQLSIHEYRTFDCNIREVLMQYNFNAKDFVDFYKEKLDADLQQIPAGEKRADRIAWHRGYLKDLLPHKWLHYDSEKPSLLKALDKYLKQREKRNYKESSIVPMVNLEPAREPKIQTALNQSQLVKLFMVLSEGGYINVDSKTHLAQWLSQTFNKDTGGGMSPNYLKKIASRFSIDEREETVEALEMLMQSLED